MSKLWSRDSSPGEGLGARGCPWWIVVSRSVVAVVKVPQAQGQPEEASAASRGVATRRRPWRAVVEVLMTQMFVCQSRLVLACAQVRATSSAEEEGNCPQSSIRTR